MMQSAGPDADWVFARYEAIRSRLPQAVFPARSVPGRSLLDILDDFDVFVFDAFGVLNVGDAPIPGAPGRFRQLAEQGKACFILTNAATLDPERTLRKFAALGFDVAAEQIVSSRDVLREALARRDTGMVWGVAAPATANPAELGVITVLLADDDAGYEAADGFVLLSSHDWNPDRQDRLVEALRRRPRPVLVGNPDLVAPRQGFLSVEPGYYAHDLIDRTGSAAEFFGKPFPDAFEAVLRRCRAASGERRRIAMVGDTLHTDILGGAAAGFATVLVTGHGIFADADAASYIGRSGIVPDFIIPSI